MYEFKSIKNVHLEISSRCNATCPLCPRNLFGVEIINDYPEHDMSLDEAKAIFTKEFLTQLESININGNLGDFVTARHGLDIVRYFKETNPKLNVMISTNGSARPKIWAELGRLGINVFFDIDGLKDTHHLYRQYTDWDMIIANARSFVSAGGRGTWKMIKFDHNSHQIEDCKKLASEIGLDFQLIEHGRVDGPVFNREKKLTHLIGNPLEPQNFEELRLSKAAHRHNVIVAPIRFYKHTPVPSQIQCKVAEEKSVYITATGLVYPCCWTGFYPGEMFHEGNEQIEKLQHENNAIEFGIEHAVAWFSKFNESWTKQTYEDGSLYICNNTCGVKQ